MAHWMLLPLSVLLLGLAASAVDYEEGSRRSLRSLRPVVGVHDDGSDEDSDVDFLEDLDLTDDEMDMVNKAGSLEDLASYIGVNMSNMSQMGLPQVRADACRAPQTECVDLGVGDRYWPRCKLLRRCPEGCGCVGRFSGCLPTETSRETVTVIRMDDVIGRLLDMSSAGSRTEGRQPRGRNNRRSRRNRRGQQMRAKTLTVEQHDKCSCQCKTQETHCSLELHEYRMRDCSCVCKNKQEKMRCSFKRGTHFWNNDSCRCLCVNKGSDDDCSTGQLFDETTCRCIRDPDTSHKDFFDYANYQ